MLHKRIDGVSLAKEIIDSTYRAIQSLPSGWSAPRLVSISFVHEDPHKNEAVARYVRNQKRAAEKSGIVFEERMLGTNVKKDEVLDLVKRVNVDPTITGLILQRPVPPHLSVREIQEAVHPLKG